MTPLWKYRMLRKLAAKTDTDRIGRGLALLAAMLFAVYVLLLIVQEVRRLIGA